MTEWLNDSIFCALQTRRRCIRVTNADEWDNTAPSGFYSFYAVFSIIISSLRDFIVVALSEPELLEFLEIIEFLAV